MNYTLRNILIAAALGVVGLVLAISVLEQREQKWREGKTYIQVYVAKKDIPAGTPAKNLESGGYIELTEVLKDDRAPQALSKLEPVEDLSTNATVFEGEQLTARNFADDDNIDIADSLKGTERAAAIPMSAPGSLGTLVEPGHHIDIWASNTVNNYTRTWVVARDVVVLETPETMFRAGSDEAAKPSEAPKADDDWGVYMIQASDQVMNQIMWSIAHDNELGLYFAVRPSSGDQETKLPTEVDRPDGGAATYDIPTK